MNDLISRQAAIDAIKAMPDCPNGFSDTYDKAWILSVLEEMPKEPTGWIPVSERLPEEPDEYIVSISDLFGGKVCAVSTTLFFGYEDTADGRTKDMVFYDADLERGDHVSKRVVAWQPLPKPYGGEE